MSQAYALKLRQCSSNGGKYLFTLALNIYEFAETRGTRRTLQRDASFTRDSPRNESTEKEANVLWLIRDTIALARHSEQYECDEKFCTKKRYSVSSSPSPSLGGLFFPFLWCLAFFSFTFRSIVSSRWLVSLAINDITVFLLQQRKYVECLHVHLSLRCLLV